MITPDFLLKQSRAFCEIFKATKEFPNDMELGREIRKLIEEYKEITPNLNHHEIDKPWSEISGMNKGIV